MTRDNIHWTSDSNESFQFRVAMDFVVQLEKKMDSDGVNQKELARRLGVSVGRVSQVLNDPGRLNWKSVVSYARALGLKASLVAYDDQDSLNVQGPVNSEIFSLCWQRAGCPRTAFDLEESGETRQMTVVSVSNCFSDWKVKEPLTVVTCVLGSPHEFHTRGWDFAINQSYRVPARDQD